MAPELPIVVPPETLYRASGGSGPWDAPTPDDPSDVTSLVGYTSTGDALAGYLSMRQAVSYRFGYPDRTEVLVGASPMYFTQASFHGPGWNVLESRSFKASENNRTLIIQGMNPLGFFVDLTDPKRVSRFKISSSFHPDFAGLFEVDRNGSISKGLLYVLSHYEDGGVLCGGYISSGTAEKPQWNVFQSGTGKLLEPTVIDGDSEEGYLMLSEISTGRGIPAPLPSKSLARKLLREGLSVSRYEELAAKADLEVDDDEI